MHVALNLAFLVPGETGGMEVYARELIPRLARQPGLRLTAFVTRPAAGAELGVDTVVLGLDARRRMDWVRADQLAVPRAADARGCEVIHSLASTAPVVSRARRVTTIHDLNYLLVPEAHFGLRGLGMRALVPAAAERSHRVIVGAEAVRSELVRHLGTPADKIDVVPHGVTARPPVAPTPAAELRARLGLGEGPVLLTVSAKRPHKNLPKLLDAVAVLPAERRPVIVLPGYPTEHERGLRAQAAALGLHAVFPPWLPAEDLEGLYAVAAVFVFPSLAEGFGLPVLEAMARGVPVACGNRSTLPEVAGDAALLFDPTDERAIASAILRLVDDPAEAARLRTAGRARAATFTWERAAALTAASYRRAGR